jgi:hypothetical protein
MMCDIVHVTPVLEVTACTDVLQRSMEEYSDFTLQRTAEIMAFSQACLALQALVVDSDGEEQLGRVIRWMAQHLPVSHRPAANIAFSLNTGHPVRVLDVPEGAVDSLGNAVDHDHYTTFWRLQTSLYDPEVLQSGDKWAECVKRIECVLASCVEPPQVRPRHCACLQAGSL